MSMKLLAATVSAVTLMAAAGAQAHDMDHHYNSGRYDNSSMNDNAAIQKGGSASTKAYGYNKQGDHYNTNKVRDKYSENHVYPGQKIAYGTKPGQVIKKGGSSISDPMVNAQTDTRPYGTYWR